MGTDSLRYQNPYSTTLLSTLSLLPECVNSNKYVSVRDKGNNLEKCLALSCRRNRNLDSTAPRTLNNEREAGMERMHVTCGEQHLVPTYPNFMLQTRSNLKQWKVYPESTQETEMNGTAGFALIHSRVQPVHSSQMVSH